MTPLGLPVAAQTSSPLSPVVAAAVGFGLNRQGPVFASSSAQCFTPESGAQPVTVRSTVIWAGHRPFFWAHVQLRAATGNRELTLVEPQPWPIMVGCIR